MEQMTMIILTVLLFVVTVSSHTQCSKGGDGCGDHHHHAHEKNWKECSWNKINDGKDNGEVKNCAFAKKSEKSYLKVVVSGDMRLYKCNDCCKRWFITFDGAECGPIPIDGVVYLWKNDNVHRPRVILGHCKIPKKGAIVVGFSVGNCTGYAGNVDAYTGWNSSFRIFIEEVNEPQ